MSEGITASEAIKKLVERFYSEAAPMVVHGRRSGKAALFEELKKHVDSGTLTVSEARRKMDLPASSHVSGTAVDVAPAQFTANAAAMQKGMAQLHKQVNKTLAAFGGRAALELILDEGHLLDRSRQRALDEAPNDVVRGRLEVLYRLEKKVRTAGGTLLAKVRADADGNPWFETEVVDEFGS